MVAMETKKKQSHAMDILKITNGCYGEERIDCYRNQKIQKLLRKFK